MCEKLKAAGVTPIYTTFKEPGRSRRACSTTPSAAWSTSPFYGQLNEQGTNVGPDSAVSFEKKLLEPVTGCRSSPYTNDDAASRGYGDGNLAFGKGEAAMYLQGPWALGEIAKSGPDLELGTFPLPMTDDPDERKVRVNIDLARGSPRTPPQGGRPRVPDVPLPARRHGRLQRRPARLRHDDGAAPVTDPRIVGMKQYFDEARSTRARHRRSRSPSRRELHAGHRHRCRRRADAATLDADWARLALRQ